MDLFLLQPRQFALCRRVPGNIPQVYGLLKRHMEYLVGQPDGSWGQLQAIHKTLYSVGVELI